MSELLFGSFAAFSGVMLLVGIVLTILWLLVPFAIFGIKPLLRQVLAEQRRATAAMELLAEQIHTARQAGPNATPVATGEQVVRSRGRQEPTFGKPEDRDF